MKRRNPTRTWVRSHPRDSLGIQLLPALLASISILATSLVLSGCSSGSLIFGTSTVVGTEVSGVSTAPTKVAIAYDRAEVALIPARANGETHSVYGGFDYDFSSAVGTMVLSQVFATGEAAKLASGSTVSTPPKDTGKNQSGRLFFSTGTRFGLSLDLGTDVGASVPSLLFGFKRAEFTVIPVKDNTQEVNPVFADLSIVMDRNGNVRTPDATAGPNAPNPRDPIASDRLPGSKTGIRIVQRFATGQAALNLAASNEPARAKLADAAGVATAAQEAVLETMDEGAALEANLRSRVTDHSKQQALLAELDAAQVFKFGIPTWDQFLTSLPTYLSGDHAADVRTISNKYLNETE